MIKIILLILFLKIIHIFAIQEEKYDKNNKYMIFPH